MKTRTLTHMLKVHKWAINIVFFVTWFGTFWILDAKDVEYIPTIWVEWWTARVFPLRIGLMVVYFGIVFVIVHYWYKLIKWVVTGLIHKFY